MLKKEIYTIYIFTYIKKWYFFYRLFIQKINFNPTVNLNKSKQLRKINVCS